MFCTRVAWVCLVWYVCCCVRRRLLSNVFATNERRVMGLYDVPLSIYLLGFGMGSMLANFHMCSIMLVLRAVLNMLVWNESPRGPMCFSECNVVSDECAVPTPLHCATCRCARWLSYVLLEYTTAKQHTNTATQQQNCTTTQEDNNTTAKQYNTTSHKHNNTTTQQHKRITQRQNNITQLHTNTTTQLHNNTQG